ncbi:MAG: hypothetical protein U0Y68_13870, partial [Blastocatellia bacterium]
RFPTKGLQKPCVQQESAHSPTTSHNLSPLTERARPSTCNKYDPLSEEEIIAKVKKRQADLQEVKKLFPFLIRFKAQHHGQDWSGMEVCPVCHQKLFIEYFGLTRTTGGKCETPSCLAWLE